MKKSIWKFVLDVTNYQKLLMPKGSIILSTQSQYDKICIWAICDTETNEKEDREFEIYGTGNPFYENRLLGKESVFIGTIQLYNGTYICHLFELKNI